MKGSPYRERDHEFGQLVLIWRTELGLTQSALAEKLGVSRETAGAWEVGLIYPTAEHLQHFISLAVERRALTAGREREQIAAFWQAANQKVPLNDTWLTELLATAHAGQAVQPPRTALQPRPAPIWIGMTPWRTRPFMAASGKPSGSPSGSSTSAAG